MKEEKTKKRRLLYYLVLAISICLLTAATVLTVYFVTQGGGSEMLEEEPPFVTPVEPDDPNDEKPDEGKNEPTGGEAEKFCLPVAYDDASVYNVIYKNKTTGFIYRHQGIDFAAEEGTKVAAIADGTIEEISLSERNGNLIIVNHGGGVKSYYKFVDPNTSLKVGAKVSKGEYFATVAKAHGPEAKDGEHLHFEMTIDGKLANPASYLNIQYAEK